MCAQALLEARREAEALSLALENPGNQSRWRLLDGKIPDKEELTAKLQQLEERLAGRKEALLEKELILEEVTQLSDKLRQQVSPTHAPGMLLVPQHASQCSAAALHEFGSVPPVRTATCRRQRGAERRWSWPRR